MLDHLGVAATALLGHGGEASVYAIDDDRIVRVLHPGAEPDRGRRTELVDELRSGPTPFALPEALDSGVVGSRHYVIERRLAGRSVSEQLARLRGSERRDLVVAHLDAAARLGDLHLEPRGWFGDLIAPEPVRAGTWHDYLVEKVARSIERAPGFGHLDPEQLAAELPECDRGSFVHLDAFSGNMLAVGTAISAVIDIGSTSIVGDRRLDPLTAAVYLCSDSITPAAEPGDHDVVHGWLADVGLAQWFEPARRWIAGFWAWAVEDRSLHQWCRQVLL